MALEIRYVGNTNMGGWTTWNMNGSAQWSMLKGENGFYDEFRQAQPNLRANIIAARATRSPTRARPAPRRCRSSWRSSQGIPLGDARNQIPTNYTSAQLHVVVLVQPAEHVLRPTLTTIAGHGLERAAAGRAH